MSAGAEAKEVEKRLYRYEIPKRINERMENSAIKCSGLGAGYIVYANNVVGVGIITNSAKCKEKNEKKNMSLLLVSVLE